MGIIYPYSTSEKDKVTISKLVEKGGLRENFDGSGEDTGSVPGTHMMVHEHPVSPVPGDPTPDLSQVPSIYVVYIHADKHSCK